ncbi:hypothetical protein [Mucisphaera calidilacus]|uniref:Uncharacterized protein n=1 Tax=Mucisphaera calidilacus TaxID=2527982 RepID=A0A518BV30_9BACT|nr:hypothetical protein [Mucisphaera calidilacus]QDU70794.1 hypothetical protein Pan265_06310 [Mucisphaera calidilacus]
MQIAFFTTPKPFHGHAGVIQRNALRSWARLDPRPEIILLGDDAGTAEMAFELGAEHLLDIPRTDEGMPQLDGLFRLAEQHTSARYLNFINADVILTHHFWPAARAARRAHNRLLMVGRRYDVRIDDDLSFDDGWDDRLIERAHSENRLGGPQFIDYFLYRRGIWGRIPPFSVARYSWDNWMVFRARQQRVPVIDATAALPTVHQNHEPAEVNRRRQGVRLSPGARRNLELAGGKECLYTIWDSTHVLNVDLSVSQRRNSGLGGGIWTYRRSTRLAG